MLKILKKDYGLKNLPNKYIDLLKKNKMRKQNCEHIAFHLDGIRKNRAKIRITKDRIFDNK